MRLSLCLVALAGCWLAGCSTSPTTNTRNVNAVIPSKAYDLSTNVSIPLEKMIYWGVYAGAAYLVLDPLAPNWDIEQARFTDDRYHLSLRMKRVYSGGAGEARTVFHRRAKELMMERGYDGYQVVEYSEGLESSVLGSQRTAEGVIRLTKSDEG